MVYLVCFISSATNAYASNGSIGHNYQEVSYNSWGKISSAWSYDPNDFYYYSVEYGPDQQRVWTQLDKTYNIEYSKYYWDDYEEKVAGSDITRSKTYQYDSSNGLDTGN